MRMAMRALVYLALPSVAFAWLLTVDLPTVDWGVLDVGFFIRDPSNGVLPALLSAALVAGIVIAIVAVASVFGAPARPRRRGVDDQMMR
jgi:hypothetical protein